MKTSQGKNVFVGMSGGVDSSVAAHLLKKQGFYVTGVFIRSYNLDGCAEQDAEDARRVAEKLKIPFYVWDFEDEYKKKVVNYMIDGYRRGLTPNPDVMCNSRIKFGFFLNRALEMGADFVATGHYVRLMRKSQNTNYKSQKNARFQTTNYRLFTAEDSNKDQSYFLWTLTQEQLARCLFPIGNYLKPEVRKIAKKAGLPTAEKKDSQGICFLGRVKLNEFLTQYIKPKKGPVRLVLPNGKYETIGEHRGAYFYTIGQRHGLNLNNKGHSASDRGYTEAHYITSKDIKTNTITVAEGSDHEALFKKEIYLRDVNFINALSANSRELAHKGIKVFARVRYRQPLSEAKLQITNSKLQKAKLVFQEPVKFVAPGQSAVFYLPAEALAKEGEKNLQMLGGGIIV